MKDLTVSLEDRPGTLADLGEALGKAGINIEGMCAVASEGRSIIHLLVTDAAAARTALGRRRQGRGEAEPLISSSLDQSTAPGPSVDGRRYGRCRREHPSCICDQEPRRRGHSDNAKALRRSM
jgi:hypothetical protein